MTAGFELDGPGPSGWSFFPDSTVFFLTDNPHGMDFVANRNSPWPGLRPQLKRVGRFR